MSFANKKESPQQEDNETKRPNVASTISVEDANERRPSKKISMTSTGAIIREENEHSLTMVQTIIHVMKGNIGTGMLALPRAVSLAGLWVGSIGLVIICVFCIQCMHLIVQCAQRLCVKTGRSNMSYADVAEHTLSTSSNKTLHKYSRYVRPFIDTLLCFTQVGFCCAYMVFIPQNMFQVLNANDSCLEYYPLMAIGVIPIFVVMSITNLDWLAPFSLTSILMLLYGLIIICYYAFSDLPPISEVPAFGTWSGIPIWFATAMYSFEGIGVILPLENQMKEPKKMVATFGTINISMTLCAIMYLMMGFFGCWHWVLKEEIQGSITLNLPDYDWEAQSTKVVMALAVFLTYPLQMYPIVEIFLPSIQKRFPERLSLVVELVFRYCLVALTFALAAAIPKIELFISLIGAVASSVLALIAPALMHTVVFWDDFNGFSGKFKIGRNMFLFILGIIGMVAGTIVSVKDIVDFFVHPPPEGNYPKCNDTSTSDFSTTTFASTF